MGMAPVSFQSPGKVFVAECRASTNEGMWHDMGRLQFFAIGVTTISWSWHLGIMGRLVGQDQILPS